MAEEVRPDTAEAPRRRKRKYSKRVNDDGASLRDGCPSNQEKRSNAGKSARQRPHKIWEQIAKEATGEFLLPHA
jgi:hypothetical protein